MRLIEQVGGLQGALLIVVKDASGRVKARRRIRNLVVTTGRNYIASRIVNAATTALSHMAIGTGAVAPALGDTALGAEVGRVALGSGSATGNVASFSANFPAGTGTGAITEAGMFNAAAAGTMVCRATFGVINKAAGDSMTVTWTITVS